MVINETGSFLMREAKTAFSVSSAFSSPQSRVLSDGELGHTFGAVLNALPSPGKRQGEVDPEGGEEAGEGGAGDIAASRGGDDDDGGGSLASVLAALMALAAPAAEDDPGAADDDSGAAGGDSDEVVELVEVVEIEVVEIEPPAPALFLGPLPYLSVADSPFDLGGPAFAFEDFEDGVFNVPGVVASAGAPLGPSGNTDSVDADDGVIDGFGQGGNSFLSLDGPAGITFTFDTDVLGALPTSAGIV